MRYAQQDNSHPVGANVERVRGWTGLFDTPDLRWEDEGLALPLVDVDVLGAVLVTVVVVVVDVVVVVGVVPMAVVDDMKIGARWFRRGTRVLTIYRPVFFS